MIKNNEIVIFEAEDKSIILPVAIEHETVWLNRIQMAELFHTCKRLINITNTSLKRVVFFLSK